MISLKSAGLVASVLVGMVAAPVQTVKLEESGQAGVGKVAPSFGGWDLSGKNVLTFDKLLKNPSPAPLLMTFGASWCAPCNAGLPRLVALQKRHPELRLVLIDVESDQAAAQAFAARAGLQGPALLDKFEQVARSYGLQESGKLALPRTFLIDSKGRVRAIYREEGADLEQVIESDLAALAGGAAAGAPTSGAPR